MFVQYQYAQLCPLFIINENMKLCLHLKVTFRPNPDHREGIIFTVHPTSRKFCHTRLLSNKREYSMTFHQNIVFWGGGCLYPLKVILYISGVYCAPGSCGETETMILAVCQYIYLDSSPPKNRAVLIISELSSKRLQTDIFKHW